MPFGLIAPGVVGTGWRRATASAMGAVYGDWFASRLVFYRLQESESFRSLLSSLLGGGAAAALSRDFSQE